MTGDPEGTGGADRLHLPPAAFDGFDVQVMVDRPVYARGEAPIRLWGELTRSS